ncbi:hypothetical protein D3C86_1568790 [compost metagenome]
MDEINRMPNRKIRTPKLKLISGMAKEDNPVKATIMTRIGLMMLASTAAWPRINAPTMPIVGPMTVGMRMPASLTNSNEISIMSTSIKAGKGTRSRVAPIASNKSVCIISS